MLLGLASGVALTAAAGAQRTDTAYPRLLRWSNAASVQVIPDCTGLRGFYAALARLPQVASMSTEVVYSLGRPRAQAAPPRGSWKRWPARTAPWAALPTGSGSWPGSGRPPPIRPTS